MTNSSTTVVYRRIGPWLGQGGYGNAYKAVLESSGVAIAYKKSRVSLRVQRTTLRHEARVMQLLQGHPAIPRLIGYRREPHFDYLGMELLGKNIKTTISPGYALNPGTVARIGEQVLSALEHLYLHNIIHRDIKPENILTCPSNPAHVRLIDFGIARHLGTDMITAPKKLYNPVEDNRPIIGSLQWCSLNAHSGYDLRPQDDIESLAYTLFFLVLGNVPWRRTGAYVHESPRNAMARIDAAKRAFGGALPVSGSPTEFSDLLQVARIPTTRLVPSLASTRQMLDNLASRLGIQRGAPLDWTPIAVTTQMPDHSRIDPISSTAPNRLVIEDGVVNSPYSNSYYGWDISDWDNIRYERSLSATFPSHDAELLDGQIPELGRILDEE